MLIVACLGPAGRGFGVSTGICCCERSIAGYEGAPDSTQRSGRSRERGLPCQQCQSRLYLKGRESGGPIISDASRSRPRRISLAEPFQGCCIRHCHKCQLSRTKQRRKQRDEGQSEVLVLSPRAYVNATSMFARSLGYFWTDVLYIMGCRFCGHRPHMWRERLGHHALQTLANLSCLVRGPGLEARRCTLAFAYMAEASSVPLRLLALARRANAGDAVLGALRVCTLWVFGLSRILNGAFCMSLLVASRHHVSERMLMLQLSGGAAAYAGVTEPEQVSTRPLHLGFTMQALQTLSQKEHDKTVAEYVAVMKQLDEALQATEGKDWAEKHGVKDKIDALYKEAPLSLLSKSVEPGHQLGLRQSLDLAAEAAARLRKLRSTLS
ncbi:unnamed protein product [Symbiodinium natans]|uniref:Uncharacterized protein n=1 Tax=Symbiodinium natans TaxID=878477 RepID=A0A812QLL7_9DINO|nr:unnamed protein product [Symbiodinium natans]